MSNELMHIVVKVSISAENATTVLPLGQSLVGLSQQEEGIIYYDFVKAKDSDNVSPEEYYIIEKYKDKAAVDFHFNTEHFKTIVPSLIEKGMNIKFLKKAQDKSTGIFFLLILVYFYYFLCSISDIN